MKKKIFLIILVFLSFFYLTYIKINEKKLSYFILNYNNIWVLKNGKVEKINSKKIENLNYKKSNLYVKNKIINGHMHLDYTTLNFYDLNNYKRSFLSDSMITINTKKNYDVLYIDTIISESDKEIIKKYLKEKNEEYDEENLFFTKIFISDDNIFYNVRTIEDLDYYSYIFLFKDNNYTDLYYASNKNRISYLNFAFDIDNDNDFDLVLISDYLGSAGNECYSLYLNENNDYKPVINCEEGD